MGNIYQTEPSRNLILYTVGNAIIFRSMKGNNPGRGVILSNDFSNSLTSTIYNDTIYFSYVNPDGDIIIRNITDSSPVKVINSLNSINHPSPVITTIGGCLIIIYISHNPLDNTYCLKCSYPFDLNPDINITGRVDLAPDFNVMSVGDRIYVHAAIKEKNGIVMIDKKGMNKLYDTASAKKIFSQKYEEEILKKDAIIESIKKQYQELMQTASRYRDEVIKWKSRR